MLIVSELFYPNKTSTAHIMTEIAKSLATSEKVCVVTSNIIYDENVSGKEEYFNYIEIIKQKSIHFDKNNFVFRSVGSLINGVLLSMTILFRIKKNEKLFAVTNPFTLILILGILKKFKKFDYTLLVHDVFPENTVPAGIAKKESEFYKILLNLYNWAYRQADRLIVLGGDMKELILNKKVSDNKIKVIPNWYDDDLKVHTVDRLKYYNNIDTKNKVIIGFAGNIGRVQSLEKFIRIFNKISNPNLLLFIIGEGANLENCKKAALSPNIYFFNPKPRQEQNLFLNSFDIGLVTLSEGMYGIGVPSKTYNLLALGKKIFYIGDKNSEIDVLNDRKNIGWSFDWQNEELIIKTLNSIKHSDFSEENFKLAQDEFTQDIILKKIKDFVFNDK